MQHLMNDGWRFAMTKNDAPQPAPQAFSPVALPHDWLIYDADDLYKNSD